MVVGSSGYLLTNLDSVVSYPSVNLQEGTAEEILAGLNLVPPRQDAMTKAVRVAANYLVWGLYSAFPITVTSICEFGSEKESPNGHHAGSCPPEWVSVLCLLQTCLLVLLYCHH